MKKLCSFWLTIMLILFCMVGFAQEAAPSEGLQQTTDVAVATENTGTLDQVNPQEVENEEQKQEEKMEPEIEAAFLVLNGFGVVLGYEDGSVGAENPVTRAEFTAMICRILGYEGMLSAPPQTPSFQDTPANHWAYEYIEAMHQLRIIDGYGDGNFRPDAPVMYEEAFKMIVSTLGYDAMAQVNGGYPIGYLYTATQIGITRNIVYSSVDNALRGQLFKALYNALKVDLMEDIDLRQGSSEFVIVHGTTLLSNLEQSKNTRLFDGRVTAMGATSLVGESSISNEQIEIDGVVIDLQEQYNLLAFLGHKVIAFADGQSSSINYVLRTIHDYPGKNRTFTLVSGDIVSFADMRYSYIAENGNTKTVSVAQNATVIYNSAALDAVTDQDFCITNGVVTLLDFDSNDEYETVFIQEYSSYIVSSVDAANQLIYCKEDRINPRSSIEISTDETSYFFLNRKGDNISVPEEKMLDFLQQAAPWEESNFSNIQQGDIITVFASRNNTVTTLLLSDQRVVGKVTNVTYEDGEAEIDNVPHTLYKLSEEEYAILQSDLNMLDATTFYIDVFGNLVAVDTAVAQQLDQVDAGELKSHGYLYILETETVGFNIFIRALKGTTIQQGEEKDTISGQTVITLECNHNLKLNDKQVSSSEDLPKNMIVEYWLDSDGLVKSIEYASYHNPNNKKYNKEFMVFTDNTLDGAFKVDSATEFFVVPTTAVKNEDYEMNFQLQDGATHKVTSYGERYLFDTGIQVAAAALISTNTVAHQPGIITDNTPVTVVNKVVTMVDDDGYTVKALYGFLDGEEGKWIFRDDVPDSRTKGLMVGDMLKLSLDADGNIDDYEKIASIATLKEDSVWYRAGARGKNERVFGKVYNIRENVLQPLKGQVVTQIDVVYNDDFSEIRTYDISNDFMKNFYIYDTSERNSVIRHASTQEILSCMSSGENADSVFVYLSMSDVKCVVIIKN